MRKRRWYALGPRECLANPEQRPELRSLAVIRNERLIGGKNTIERRHYSIVVPPDWHRADSVVPGNDGNCGGHVSIGLCLGNQMKEEMNSTSWYVWMQPLLWARRRFLISTGGVGLLLSILVAFALPKQYQSTVRLMPPGPQAQAGAAMLGATVLGGGAGASGGLAGLMSSRSPNATFLAILQSRTVQDNLIDRFKLRNVYGCNLYLQARKKLAKNTILNDDRKTNVLEVTVTA
ncbi:MAG: Wzz/FepE/Etk N-terminal domain-containing protein, partial [Terracidiphilus sp.]